MSLELGKPFPNFTANTTHGELDFYKWKGDAWAILFSHPADFTPVCTTELGAVAKLMPEFEKRNVKVIALSIDSVEDHEKWIEDIKAYNKLSTFPYPIIADENSKLAVRFKMLDQDEIHLTKGIPAAARTVFFVGPDNKLKMSILYPATTGRNFAEILRVIDSIQLTANHSVATPANWTFSDRCMIVPSLSDEEAKKKFPGGFEKPDLPSNRGYIRVVPQPQ